MRSSRLAARRGHRRRDASSLGRSGSRTRRSVRMRRRCSSTTTPAALTEALADSTTTPATSSCSPTSRRCWLPARARCAGSSRESGPSRRSRPSTAAMRCRRSAVRCSRSVRALGPAGTILSTGRWARTGSTLPGWRRKRPPRSHGASPGCPIRRIPPVPAPSSPPTCGSWSCLECRPPPPRSPRPGGRAVTIPHRRRRSACHSTASSRSTSSAMVRTD